MQNVLAERVCAKLCQVAHIVPQAAHAYGNVEFCAGNGKGVFPHAVQRAFAFGNEQAHRFPDKQYFGRHGS